MKPRYSKKRLSRKNNKRKSRKLSKKLIGGWDKDRPWWRGRTAYKRRQKAMKSAQNNFKKYLSQQSPDGIPIFLNPENDALYKKESQKKTFIEINAMLFPNGRPTEGQPGYSISILTNPEQKEFMSDWILKTGIPQARRDILTPIQTEFINQLEKLIPEVENKKLSQEAMYARIRDKLKKAGAKQTQRDTNCNTRLNLIAGAKLQDLKGILYNGYFSDEFINGVRALYETSSVDENGKKIYDVNFILNPTYIETLKKSQSECTGKTPFLGATKRFIGRKLGTRSAFNRTVKKEEDRLDAAPVYESSLTRPVAPSPGYAVPYSTVKKP